MCWCLGVNEREHKESLAKIDTAKIDGKDRWPQRTQIYRWEADST